ncbi:hypothetical protein LCGC14_0417650 [marine sediment metagenome]|uniref:Ribosomal RNA methyltransferase FtsJ domain-containing protein n=1 Tax=marine sediment metagenome TaxID=412755 RepID=A0A0F9SXM6_9ZZZZ
MNYRALRPEKYAGRGKHCYVEPYKPNSHDGLGLKIFDAYPNPGPLETFNWGDDPPKNGHRRNVRLIDATIFQNYCAWRGLAPRVYEITQVKRNGNKYWAQLTDYLYGDFDEDNVAELYEKVKEIGRIYGFTTHKNEYQRGDAIDGKFFDFNTFYPVENRLEIIKKLYVEKGRYGKIYYHNVVAFGLNNSPRHNKKRITWMGLDKLDFRKKHVLDIGCAGGYFMQYASKKGAKNVFGFDNKSTIEAAHISANEQGHWKLGFYERDFTEKAPVGEAQHDIVLYLSMNYHIGLPEHLFDTVAKDGVLVIEDNAKDREENLLPSKIGDRFERIELVGRSLDHGNKPTYHCYGRK